MIINISLYACKNLFFSFKLAFDLELTIFGSWTKSPAHLTILFIIGCLTKRKTTTAIAWKGSKNSNNVTAKMTDISTHWINCNKIAPPQLVSLQATQSQYCARWWMVQHWCKKVSNVCNMQLHQYCNAHSLLRWNVTCVWQGLYKTYHEQPQEEKQQKLKSFITYKLASLSSSNAPSAISWRLLFFSSLFRRRRRIHVPHYIPSTF